VRRLNEQEKIATALRLEHEEVYQEEQRQRTGAERREGGSMHQMQLAWHYCDETMA
jgi:hypothetical protein